MTTNGAKAAIGGAYVGLGGMVGAADVSRQVKGTSYGSSQYDYDDVIGFKNDSNISASLSIGYLKNFISNNNSPVSFVLGPDFTYYLPKYTFATKTGLVLDGAYVNNTSGSDISLTLKEIALYNAKELVMKAGMSMFNNATVYILGGVASASFYTKQDTSSGIEYKFSSSIPGTVLGSGLAMDASWGMVGVEYRMTSYNDDYVSAIPVYVDGSPNGQFSYSNNTLTFNVSTVRFYTHINLF